MQYRLQQITEIQKLLESERQKREKLSTNYKKCLKAVKATEAVLAISFIGLSTVSVVFLSTIITSPAVTVIEAVSLGAGLLFIVGGFVSRHLILKAEKHRKIKLLADKKLNVISDLVSKALDDETISDEEFCLVLSELDKFFDKKEKIRLEAKSSEGSLINKIKTKVKALKLR